MRPALSARTCADEIVRAIAGNGREPPLALVGVEHEYSVRREGKTVPFATLIDSVAPERKYLDPGDAHARRLRTGVALTCDGEEAEIALAPVAVSPGFAARIASAARRERAALSSRLGAAGTLEGFSTHISVSVPGPADLADAVARAYVATWAPSMMLLIDHRASWGISVRPRPGRIEICGEFVAGTYLARALVFAAASVMACTDSVTGTSGAGSTLPCIAVSTRPDVDRHGYVVSRRSFGGDLYASGRSCALRTVGGDCLSAGTLLVSSWTVARGGAMGWLSSAEISDVDRVVHGTARLPRSPGAGGRAGGRTGAAHGASDFASREPPGQGGIAHGPVPCPDYAELFGRLAGPIHRNGYDMAPVMMTWDTTVEVVADPQQRRHAFLCVPRGAMRSFLDALDSGALDGGIRRYLGTRPRRARLDRYADAQRVGVYDELGPRRALLPHEFPRCDVAPSRRTTGVPRA